MIPKALQAYATLQALWSKSYDIIEVHALLAIAFLQKRVDGNEFIFADDNLLKFYGDEYGLSNIPTIGVRRIAQKLIAKKLLSKTDGKYKINVGKLAAFISTMPETPDINEDLIKIKGGIKNYAADKYSKELSDDAIENGLIDFFDSNEAAIILEGRHIDELTKRKAKSGSAQVKFIISMYIQEQEVADTPEYAVLLKFAIGHMISSAMALDEFVPFQGKLTNLDAYVDSPVIFNLLGLSEGPFEIIASELLSRLNQLGAHLKMAVEHYNEIANSINYAIGLLEAEYPDKEHGNRIYFQAIEKNLSADDLRLKLKQVAKILKKYQITVEGCPPKYAGFGTLNENTIRGSITTFYTKGKDKNLPQHVQNSIKRDAKVLNLISKIRDGMNPNSLHEAKAILITTNLNLCRVSLKEDLDYVQETIPMCLSSETVSLILWANNPRENKQLNKLSLACDCAKVTGLNATMLRYFYKDIKEKHASHAISDEDYLTIVASRITNSELQKYTFNSEDLYTDETALEIARRVAADKEVEITETQRKILRQEQRLRKISTTYANVVDVIMFLLLCFIAYLSKFWDWSSGSLFCRVIGIVISAFALFFGAASWFRIFPPKEKFHKWIEQKIYNLLHVE